MGKDQGPDNMLALALNGYFRSVAGLGPACSETRESVCSTKMEASSITRADQFSESRQLGAGSYFLHINDKQEVPPCSLYMFPNF